MKISIIVDAGEFGVSCTATVDGADAYSNAAANTLAIGAMEIAKASLLAGRWGVNIGGFAIKGAGEGDLPISQPIHRHDGDDAISVRSPERIGCAMADQDDFLELLGAAFEACAAFNLIDMDIVIGKLNAVVNKHAHLVELGNLPSNAQQTERKPTPATL